MEHLRIGIDGHKVVTLPQQLTRQCQTDFSVTRNNNFHKYNDTFRHICNDFIKMCIRDSLHTGSKIKPRQVQIALCRLAQGITLSLIHI